MTIEQLRMAVQQRPFRPLDICMSDGQSMRVRSPEFILIPPTAQRTFVVYLEPEAYDIVDPLLVTSLHFGRKHANGRAGRRRR